jgi:hypothetical protein
MSQLATGIFGAFAVSLACGAVQLASGHDLSGMLRDRLPVVSGTPEAAVNRAAKADRASGASRSGMQTRTISLRLDGLADTSILVRIPLAAETRESGNKEAEKEVRDNPIPSPTKAGDRKVTLACEPMVSMLTEIAKRLQPGRCLT